jgi:hypothetical protein
MLIIHDKRLPKEAIATLRQYGECLPFYTENITYEEIAGHPDIFFFPIREYIIVAPNTPSQYISFLKEKRFSLKTGNTVVGKKKENSTCYNVVLSDNYIIHNEKFTDISILENIKNKTFLHVNQAYTRCSLMPLKNDTFITSDIGIEKELSKNGLNCCYISPQEILLPGFPYGFIGGCMGVCQDTIFIIGNLDYHSQGKELRKFLFSLNYDIVELYNGKLFDGGSLLFL